MNPRKAKWAETRGATASRKQAEADPKVCLYHRVSSRKQADEMTIKRQQTLTRQIFERQFRDERALVAAVDDEAYNFEKMETDRGFWSKIVPLITAGECNTIIVASEDRIFRGASAELRGKVTDLFRRYGIRVVSPGNTVHYDNGQTSGRLVTSIQAELGSIAKLETVKTLFTGRLRRLQEDEAFRLAVWPYGYRLEVVGGKRKSYQYVVEPKEAQIVRDIFALYAGRPTEVLPASDRRLGSTSIAELLNRLGIGRAEWKASLPSGIQAQTRDTWDTQSVLRVITNETYTGKLTVVFQPTEKIPGYSDEAAVKRLTIPGIVPEDLFNAVLEVYDQRRLRLLDERTSRLQTNWLHRLIECPVCSRPMDGLLATNGMRYYRCADSTKDNPHGMLRAEDAEGMLEAEVVSLLTSSLDFKRLMKELGSRSSNDPSAEAQKELNLVSHQLEDLNKQLKRLTESFVKGVVEEDMYVELKKDLSEKITFARLSHENLSKRLASLGGRVEPELESLRSAFLAAMDDGETRREILKAFVKVAVERIVVEKLGAANLSELSEDEIKALYLDGRVTAKAIRDHLGWTHMKLTKAWGKSGRKSAIDYRLSVNWKR